MSAVVYRRPPDAPPTPVPVRVGMVGAGQLAQMTHQAAIGLGVELHVLAASLDEPAVRAGARATVGSPASLEDLRALAASCTVLTFDHERVDPGHLRTLAAEGALLAPGAPAKLMAQDKLHARRALADAGFPVPPFAHAETVADIERFAARHGWPLIAKAPRGGYDGRGVWTVDGPAEGARILEAVPGGLLLEPRLWIERELAVLVARSSAGELAAYPVVETVQQDAMCREIIAPAPIDDAVATEARTMALAIAERIGAVGVLAVELFVTPDGLVLNELALRPHNSGHFTIEGAVTSQFEQHLRAILGWPLGPCELRAPAVATVNVIGQDDGGDPRLHMAWALTVPDVHVHLYDKQPAPGRKLGHVTAYGDVPREVRARAARAAALLEGRRPA